MTRRAKIWWVVAVLFALVNLGGMWIAALRGELIHTGIHVALLIPAVYLVWRLTPRRVANY